MSVIDVESLLAPISDDAPSGEDLEYDPEFGEMERSTEGKPEQQFGDTIVEGEEPDWKQVKSKSLDLLKRTKDLRVTAHLSRAVLAVDGWVAFSEVLALMRGYIEQFWENVHPQLDPDDDNDPTFRVNTLASLVDKETTLRLVEKTPLVKSKMVGIFTLRDLEVAQGERDPRPGEEAPSMATIEAAFTDTEVEELQETDTALKEAIEHLRAIEDTVTEQVGAANSVRLDDLVKKLVEAEKVYADQLDRRGVGEADEEAAGENGEGGGGGGGGSAKADALSGRISSREEVLKALDMICDYYNRFEPSSPLPLLIKRAKRLATKSFLEIIRDLTPDALQQAELIAGADGSEEESGSE